jgi:hypothetical protein
MRLRKTPKTNQSLGELNFSHGRKSVKVSREKRVRIRYSGGNPKVQDKDYKGKKIPTSARIIPIHDTYYVNARDGSSVNALLRKAKCITPSKAKNLGNRPNLGRVFKEFPLRKFSHKVPLCGLIKTMLKSKTEYSFKFLTKCQDLLVGTAYESDFYYHACSPYLKARAGLLLISRKPSIGATRLILTQLLRVSSNFPWERLDTEFCVGL